MEEKKVARWSKKTIEKAVNNFIIKKGLKQINLEIDEPTESERKRVLKLAKEMGYKAELSGDKYIRIYS